MKDREDSQGCKKKISVYRGIPLHPTADLIAGTLQTRGVWQEIFTALKRKNSTENTVPSI
jgi:hypothetical protein